MTAPRLYSYCIPFDHGAAPNPYWGACTLVICKPAIRRSARVGDWIVGTGSKGARVDPRTTRDLSGHVVYAMKVDAKLTMQQYDQLTKTRLREKVPVLTHPDSRRRLGDSLYDFSTTPVTQRPGVHRFEHQARDLSGRFALLSTKFHYFGAQPVELPEQLLPIAPNRQGHRVMLNEPYVELFISWIESQASGVQGEPLLNLFGDVGDKNSCAGSCEVDDTHDEEIVARC